ncbi:MULTISPECIES: hypothetical protein [Streptomyces]|jgi:hypothetical protein|uniref:Secreted protein n=2 Tax=Streptomyces bottropensis TaxID=42235 RepID=M3DL78_9ACTN|nr:MULTISPECIES: hypothetical protein [Streptomyces]EMF57667.1 hypothetical protein SBD_0339 [Streptomyces bottropensis ATCC 25435]MZD18196.1 hypothetical protein [Streptomyces sp. SID5476]
MRRSSLSRWAAAAGLVAVVVAVAAWRTAATASDSEAQPEPGSTVNEVRQDPKTVRDHWTPERMREAQDAPMPKRD